MIYCFVNIIQGETMEIINQVVVKVPGGGKKIKLPDVATVNACGNDALARPHTHEGGCQVYCTIFKDKTQH